MDARPAPLRLLAAVSLAAAVALAACGTSPTRRPVPATSDLPAGVEVVVQRVVDGDTLVAGGERIRLLGVDTPETKDPRRPVGCFGEKASRFTSSLLPAGTRVRLVGDTEQRDRFNRLLAYVYRLPDGLFVNEELLRQGYAQVLTVPPNVAHADRFVAVAAEARAAGRGLWAACGPGQPA